MYSRTIMVASLNGCVEMATKKVQLKNLKHPRGSRRVGVYMEANQIVGFYNIYRHKKNCSFIIFLLIWF